jgi:HEPN domain-containing protein
MKSKTDWDDDIRAWYSFWVQFTFRDGADKDYISARLLLRNKLYQTGAWSSLQAVEKYLKCILLYSYKSTKIGNGHDLVRLWEEVLKLADLGINMPAQCVEFLKYLSNQGTNRYLDYAQYSEGDELWKLDRCVWHIRRYCQDFGLLPGMDNVNDDKRTKLLTSIPKESTLDNVKSFTIPNGYLENVVNDTNNPNHSALVWKNLFYGQRKRHHHIVTGGMTFERPVHMINPEILDLIAEVVHFPTEVLIELRQDRDKRLQSIP